MSFEFWAGLIGFLGVVITAIVAYRSTSPAARNVARAFRALNCATDYRRMALDMGIEDSDGKREFMEIDERYQALLKEYENLNGLQSKK